MLVESSMGDILFVIAQLPLLVIDTAGLSSLYCLERSSKQDSLSTLFLIAEHLENSVGGMSRAKSTEGINSARK